MNNHTSIMELSFTHTHKREKYLLHLAIFIFLKDGKWTNQYTATAEHVFT